MHKTLRPDEIKIIPTTTALLKKKNTVMRQVLKHNMVSQENNYSPFPMKCQFYERAY